MATKGSQMAEKVNLTAGRIADLKCPAGKSQEFLRDSKCPWLAVRVTAAGSKSFVFEGKLHGRTIRTVIGDVAAWTIEAARQEANEKKTQVDRGIDPRAHLREVRAAKAAETALDERRATIVEVAWATYLEKGKPLRKAAWKPRYVEDLKKAADPGGKPRKRGKGLTKAGPLHPLMAKRLVDIDEDAMRDWYQVESARGQVQAARCLAMFSGFLSWCSKQRDYRDLVHSDAAKPRLLSDLLPPSVSRTDALEASQLPAWFAAAMADSSRVGSTYLIGLLLTGARREELAGLKRADVDYQWNRMTIADKYGQTRKIPLAPHFRRMLLELPVVEGNPYVFVSETSARGHISEPRSVLDRVQKRAGIDHMTVHGLRRSFSLLGEEARVPTGALAQIMGHQPSALAEKYRPRRMDALRGYMAEVEEFILRRAGVLVTSTQAVEGESPIEGSAATAAAAREMASMQADPVHAASKGRLVGAPTDQAQGIPFLDT
jgi:integrase